MFILTETQKNAISKLKKFIFNKDKKYYILKGSAGTGKTTVITKLLESDELKNFKVVFSATTNKAVSVLKQISSFNENKSYSFLTIHKLLNIRRKINKEGKEEFNFIEDNNKIVKSLSIYYYDLIIIDECSMLSNNLVIKLLSLKNFNGKIIFIGDTAQLPPVNEQIRLFDDKSIDNVELKEIMRYKGNIVNLANKIRSLVFDSNTKIKFKDYKCDTISIYKKFNKWFDSYISNLKLSLDSFEGIENLPICLTYTNKQTEEINNKVREYIFNNNYDRFMTNDIIIFNNYYYSKKNGISYYTSQKALIKDINIQDLKITFPYKILKSEEYCSVQDNSEIIDKFETIFDLLKNLKIKVWKIILSNDDIIYVVHENNEDYYQEIIESITKKIKKFKNYLNKKHGKCSCYDNLIETIWLCFYESLIDIFADISYGYCITTHKSQGSTFSNVYVDMNNIILKNQNQEESYRCLYTAITRTSEKLNILI